MAAGAAPHSTIAHSSIPAIASLGPAVILELSATTYLPDRLDRRRRRLSQSRFSRTRDRSTPMKKRPARSRRNRRHRPRTPLHRSRDGRSPSPHRVFSQHQRAPRLLLRRLLGPRRTHRYGRRHAGPPRIYAHVRRRCSRRPLLAPGDVALLNDPYRGGTHLPDITMVAPVFLPVAPAPPFTLPTAPITPTLWNVSRVPWAHAANRARGNPHSSRQARARRQNGHATSNGSNCNAIGLALASCKHSC